MHGCVAEPHHVRILIDRLLSYFGNCLAIREQHVLTMSVLKLCHNLIEFGHLSLPSCANLMPLLVGMLQEEDAFTAIKDEDWAVGVRLLLRIKMLAVTVLHLILDRAAHDTTLHLLRSTPGVCGNIICV